MKKFFLWAFLAVVFGSVALTAFAYSELRGVLGHHIPGTSATPADLDLPFENVTMSAVDGTRLAGWYVPAPQPKGAAVIVHGLGEEVGGKSESFALDTANALSKIGFSSLLIDLRSHGESEGDRIYIGTKEWMDVDAAYEFLRSQPELQNTNIGMIGDSMGAVAALLFASKTGKGDFLVASVPFTDYRTAFATWLRANNFPTVFLPFLEMAARLQLGFGYQSSDPTKHIANVRVPLFLIGAEQDDVVGGDIHDLFEKANEPKELWQPAGSTHVLVFTMREAYEDRLVDFLLRLGSAD